LDGHIFSLFGIFDYVRAVPVAVENDGAQFAKRLFADGIQGLLKALPKYDLGFWVRVNRCEVPGYPEYDPCTINYLQLICRQLEIMHKITGEQKFAEYADQFKSYIKWSNIFKMYKLKFQALINLNRL
jgi:hypothetical protein